MPFFTEIKDSRRFVVAEDARDEIAGQYGHAYSLSIFAIYDTNGRTNWYAPIGADEHGDICFVDQPVTFFDDEISAV